jgi:hypothetical protein
MPYSLTEDRHVQALQTLTNFTSHMPDFSEGDGGTSSEEGRGMVYVEEVYSTSLGHAMQYLQLALSLGAYCGDVVPARIDEEGIPVEM